MRATNLPEELPFGLVEAIEAAGVALSRRGGVWFASDVEMAYAIADTHDPVVSAKAAVLADLAAYRYEREVGGMDFIGLRIDTSREARNNLTGAVVSAQLATAAGQPFAVAWKGVDGTFATLSASDLAALGVAVAAHVAECFAREAGLGDTVNAMTSLDAVLGFDIAVAWAG